MKRVYSSQLSLMVGHMKNILESHGISCVIRNEFLAGGSGELPPTECWPELWVERDIDYERAQGIIEETLRDEGQSSEPWICPGCGERLEGQFGVCWRCGTERHH